MTPADRETPCYVSGCECEGSQHAPPTTAQAELAALRGKVRETCEAIRAEAVKDSGAWTIGVQNNAYGRIHAADLILALLAAPLESEVGRG